MFVDMITEKEGFSVCMSRVGIIPKARELVIKKWEEDGNKPIKEYAPYFSYVFQLTYFLYGNSRKSF